jgi:lactoylglutathione lyase
MSLKIDHITILVSSLEKSMGYYNQLLGLLGFEKVKEHVWTDGDGFYFQFNQAHSDANEYQRYGAGMNHLGFKAPSPEFVEQVRTEMLAAGFEVPDIQKLSGATALFMKDEDGIRFEVTYYPPGTKIVD